MHGHECRTPSLGFCREVLRPMQRIVVHDVSCFPDATGVVGGPTFAWPSMGDSFTRQMSHSLVGWTNQHVRHAVSQHAIHLFRHAPQARPQPCFNVNQGQSFGRRCPSPRQGRVCVTEHKHGIGTMFGDCLLNTSHHVAHSRPSGPAAHVEELVGFRQPQFCKELGTQGFVMVLSRVYPHDFPRGVGHPSAMKRRGLHKLRASPHHDHEPMPCCVQCNHPSSAKLT